MIKIKHQSNIFKGHFPLFNLNYAGSFVQIVQKQFEETRTKFETKIREHSLPMKIENWHKKNNKNVSKSQKLQGLPRIQQTRINFTPNPPSCQDNEKQTG